MQEIRIMRRLKDYKNVLNIYEVHEIGNKIILCVDYLEGDELFNLIYKRDHFKWEEISCIMIQCLEGLEHLQEHSICHRDIKPENLLFRHKNKSVLENQIVFVDFGMASICTSQTNSLGIYFFFFWIQLST